MIMVRTSVCGRESQGKKISKHKLKKIVITLFLVTLNSVSKFISCFFLSKAPKFFFFPVTHTVQCQIKSHSFGLSLEKKNIEMKNNSVS